MTISVKPLFKKVMIANRGEIALRVMRTLDNLNITSAAVYSEADTNSLHVEMAKEAYYIGNSPSSESYLHIPNIINAIRESGAEAVHPGYGFLSENAEFARALEYEGVKLIGPSAANIKSMGDKVEAKKIAIEAGVNTVPGYMGIIENSENAVEIAEKIGFPVFLKAAAGGGGRGMRIVRNSEEMRGAFLSAKLEAHRCFNDNRVFIEKLIEKPRHIEIQILADNFGNVVCLGERECSIQRHHQKVIEEAPSQIITDEIRKQMYNQCVNLAKKVGYYSAGTIEFIIDQDKNFYFLEMNTRLQVEHCVTELITGIDIVEQMLRIAAGQKLSFAQKDVILDGWALECRIYAEDPQRGFLPSSGRIIEYNEPPKTKHLRIDSGVGPGSEVSMFYDPLIAKICTHAPTRQEAIMNMTSALGSYIIRGISHNISLLEAIVSHKRFIEGDINTHFISEEYPHGFMGAELTSEITENLVATTLYVFLKEQKRISNIRDQIDNQFNKIATRWIVGIDDTLYPVLTKDVDGGLNIRQGSSRIFIRTNWQVGTQLFTGYVNGKFINVQIEKNGSYYKLTHAGISVKSYVRTNRIAELEALMPKKTLAQNNDTVISAPLSGIIVGVKVAQGESVKKGAELMVLTAMKMENTILAPRDAIIKDILAKEGDQTVAGSILIELE